MEFMQNGKILLRNKMVRNHDILNNLCAGVLPDKINGISIPSIYHCAGTDKLIGQYYGKAIFEDILCDDKQSEENVSLLGVLLRAYIVIDDFIKDNNIIVKKDHTLSKWLENIKNRSIELIEQMSNSPHDIWESYFHKYNDAYYNFDSSEMFNSITRKCFLIYIPFSLNVVTSKSRAAHTYSFMKNYLFALQLLDDFQDMEEDYCAPKNHNIFLSCIEESKIDSVITNKNILAPSLLLYIQYNLKDISKTIKSKTILTFIRKNIKWIDNQLLKIHSSYKPIKIKGSFSEFNFNDIMHNFLRALPSKGDKVFFRFSEIRAENMHTVTTI